MSERSWEELSAFIDGERVEPREVARALQLPGASAFLVDCAELRKQVGTTAEPRQLWAAKTRRRLSGRRGWLAAAVVTLALGGAAIWTAARFPTPAGETAPPQPDRVIELERGRDWIG